MSESDRSAIISGLLALVVVIAFGSCAVSGWRKCAKADGVYVRGAVWFACIEQGKHP